MQLGSKRRCTEIAKVPSSLPHSKHMILDFQKLPETAKKMVLSQLCWLALFLSAHHVRLTTCRMLLLSYAGSHMLLQALQRKAHHISVSCLRSDWRHRLHHYHGNRPCTVRPRLPVPLPLPVPETQPQQAAAATLPALLRAQPEQ